MSYHESTDEIAMQFGIDGEESCFMCGSPVRFPSIYWKGYPDRSIALHGECASDLVLRLARDVWEWECKTVSRRGRS